MLSSAAGVYSDLVVVSHTDEEFVLDFYFAHNADPKTLLARIVVAPKHAERLSDALAENIRKFKGKYVETNTRRVARKPIKGTGHTGTRKKRGRK